ncbi:MAG: hypothetical protein NZ908_00390 [Candidatus Micrarchaeota archaeon]|nr:hypothetical protein [Candidatus Micrarchaeota archaeon]MCX8154629.1 hypothetical protein [Candidatus Micrarchaeota archaeon]
MVKKFFIDDRLSKFRRKTAVILPKDIGIIISITALSKDDEVVEIGGGSGFATFYLARVAKRVYVFERREDVFTILRENLREFHNVELINDDGKNAKQNAYLYLIDSPDFHEILPNVVDRVMKWVVLYLPNINQAKESYELLKSLRFRAYLLRSVLEEWEVDSNVLRPKHKQLYHTAYLVFGERVV